MAMQKLNVRFSDEFKLELAEKAKYYGVSESEMARASMSYGMKQMGVLLRNLHNIGQVPVKDAKKEVLKVIAEHE